MVVRAAAAAVGVAAARFVQLLPALVLAMLCLRAAELGAGMPAGAATANVLRICGRSFAADLYALVSHLPLLFVYSLAPLLIRSRRGLTWSLGLAWSLLVLVQAGLIQYSTTARVALGADLYGYSWPDVRETISGGLKLVPLVVAGTVSALLILWLMLARRLRRDGALPSQRAVAVVFTLGFAALILGPQQLVPWPTETEDARALRLNKIAYFFDDTGAFLLRSVPLRAAPLAGPGAAAPVGPIAGFQYLYPAYPFLHEEQTPDELGAHFRFTGDSPPNLVFVIVEGLGRSFSGPDAPLGSFTPFLDELAGQGLYWENFLAVQGRTFAALPSIFGSLPYGDEGFGALGDAMPEHATLLSVLRAGGYHLRYYAGTDLGFDNERTFLRRQGVERLLDARDFGSGYIRSNDWGYGDNEMVSLALADEAGDLRQPFVTVLQTNSMHTPYAFLGQERYQARFELRLGQLGIAQAQRVGYRAYRDIYTSIMYADDALRRYVDATSKRPAYANTIFIVTGDHRLPEIPMAEWIDRYHVPLIIFSPLVKAPLRFRSVSSEFDLAPSLLAMLSHHYGIKTPALATWIGSGLDLEPSFRNLHEFPMKQTKTNLVDYVAGPWLLSRDALYSLGDGLHMEPVRDTAEQTRVAARFAAFRAANDEFARTGKLAPPGSFSRLATYAERRLPARAPVRAPVEAGLAVREVQVPARARAGDLAIDVVFGNAAVGPSGSFVPLVVMLAADGRELSETYGAPLSLAANQTAALHMQVKCAGIAAGRYFLSVLPSNPATGKRVGTGRYGIPVVIGD